jgi:hypothetical protein
MSHTIEQRQATSMTMIVTVTRKAKTEMRRVSTRRWWLALESLMPQCTPWKSTMMKGTTKNEQDAEDQYEDEQFSDHEEDRMEEADDEEDQGGEEG